MDIKQEDSSQDPFYADKDQAGDSFGYNNPPASQGSVYQTKKDTKVIVTQPYRSTSVPYEQTPDLTDLTMHAIIITLICYSPFALCAIISAIQARNSYKSGDYEAARVGRNCTKVLIIASMAVNTLAGITFVIIWYALLLPEKTTYHAWNLYGRW